MGVVIITVYNLNMQQTHFSSLNIKPKLNIKRRQIMNAWRSDTNI